MRLIAKCKTGKHGLRTGLGCLDVGTMWTVHEGDRNADGFAGLPIKRCGNFGLNDSCSCPDYATRGQPCKHVIAVEIVRHREMPDGSTVTETMRVTYAQNWPAYNKAQVHEAEHFQLLLRDLCSDLVPMLGAPKAEAA